ncbi:MAG: hypothetical protein Kow0059_05250 [Candidatus Sumerlaeia bacterium]
MPHKKHTMKALRQNKARRLRNRQAKSAMRTVIKKIDAKLAAGQAPEAQQALQGALSVIGKTARKGAVHKRTAARLQSRLTRRVNKTLAARSDGQ